MNKTQREEWDNLISSAQQKHVMQDKDILLTADVYIRKLERELQALKNKKSVAALLQKNFKWTYIKKNNLLLV